MRSHIKDQISALFFLMVGSFFAIYSRKVDIGSWHQPGPGFLPLLAGLTLCGLSIILLTKSFMTKKQKDFSSFFAEKDSWRRVFLTFLGLVLYDLLLTYLGFGLTTFLFIFYLLKFIFPQGLKRSLCIALAGSITGHIIFIELLKTQFPRGFLGF